MICYSILPFEYPEIVWKNELQERKNNFLENMQKITAKNRVNMGK